MRKPLTKTTMPLAQELKLLAALTNVDAQSNFLALAIDSIRATGHILTDFEKYGFHICILSLQENVNHALKVGGKI